MQHEFFQTCKRRLPQLVYEETRRPPKRIEGRFIQPSQLKMLEERRSTDDFKKKSATQAANKKKASEDGKLVPTHHGGSCSTLERVRRMVIYTYIFLKTKSIIDGFVYF